MVIPTLRKKFCFMLGCALIALPSLATAQEEGGLVAAKATQNSEEQTSSEIVLKDSLTVAESKMCDGLKHWAAADFPKDLTVQELAVELTELGLPTFVDMKALENEGCSPDAVLRIPSAAGTLGAQVFFGLEGQDLTLELSKGMWRITTKTEAEDKQNMLTIDISPLDMEPNDLIDAIQSTIEPLSWEDNGGPAGATISIVPVNDKVLIVVRNTTEMTLAVRSFVNKLATLAGTSPDSPTSPKMLRYENPKPYSGAPHGGGSGVGDSAPTSSSGRGGGLFGVK